MKRCSNHHKQGQPIRGLSRLLWRQYSYPWKSTTGELNTILQKMLGNSGCFTSQLATRESFLFPLLSLLFWFYSSPKATFTIRVNVCHQLQTLLINLYECEFVSTSFVQYYPDWHEKLFNYLKLSSQNNYYVGRNQDITQKSLVS